MEANKLNEGGNKVNTAANAANGFDLNGLMSGNTGEVIKYLLSTGGAVLINYLMSIKPMQDKIEALTKKVNEQEKQINDMEDNQAELIEQLKTKFQEKEQEELNGGDEEFFSIKKEKHTPNWKRKKKYLLD
jgi:hypothetical protein